MAQYFCALDARECSVAHGSVGKRIAKMRLMPSSFADMKDALDLARLHALERTLALVGTGRGWAIPDAEDAALMVKTLEEHAADIDAALRVKPNCMTATEAGDLARAGRDVLRVAARISETLPKEG